MWDGPALSEVEWGPSPACTRPSTRETLSRLMVAEAWTHAARAVCRPIDPAGVKGHPYEHGFDLRLVPKKLAEPFSWRSPKLVFVNSMSDLFQDGVSDDYIEAVCQVMAAAQWHTFKVLTKRSARLRQLLCGRLRFAAQQQHIWWGVSVEDRKYGLPRIDDLRRAPARVRFLSIEPLLEDLGKSISPALVGQLLAAKADQALARCSRSGLLLFVISVANRECRFSSSSGAELGKRKTAGCSTVGLTTNIPHGPLHWFLHRRSCEKFAEHILKSFRQTIPTERIQVTA